MLFPGDDRTVTALTSSRNERAWWAMLPPRSAVRLQDPTANPNSIALTRPFTVELRGLEPLTSSTDAVRTCRHPKRESYVDMRSRSRPSEAVGKQIGKQRLGHTGSRKPVDVGPGPSGVMPFRGQIAAAKSLDECRAEQGLGTSCGLFAAWCRLLFDSRWPAPQRAGFNDRLPCERNGTSDSFLSTVQASARRKGSRSDRLLAQLLLHSAAALSVCRPAAHSTT